MSVTFADLDRRLLNLLQDRFPLVTEPFAVLGTQLGAQPDDIVERVRRLKSDGVIRHIGGIFESAALGYWSTLVAMRVPEERRDEAAAIVSRHSGVSHNYGREHYFNLWFTLTTDSQAGLHRAVLELAGQARAEETIDLPALRVFKINAYFDMLGEDRAQPLPACPRPGPSALQGLDRELVRHLQKDLPLELRPFELVAAGSPLNADSLIRGARSLQERGIMRRYGASVRHQQAGFTANAMSCWAVPPGKLEQLGRRMASCPQISHCYERPTAPNWPYNLFAMIHGRAAEECERLAAGLSGESGMRDYVLLYSTREYKKQRLQYFS